MGEVNRREIEIKWAMCLMKFNPTRGIRNTHDLETVVMASDVRGMCDYLHVMYGEWAVVYRIVW